MGESLFISSPSRRGKEENPTRPREKQLMRLSLVGLEAGAGNDSALSGESVSALFNGQENSHFKSCRCRIQLEAVPENEVLVDVAAFRSLDERTLYPSRQIFLNSTRTPSSQVRTPSLSSRMMEDLNEEQLLASNSAGTLDA
ncbi:hypothetical protein PM082_000029 [Marasmius tenuissimus]|nr:hypothetical protein PM082_000029 [Marasmius tenuissimus]